jgi:hypothetical protein
VCSSAGCNRSGTPSSSWSVSSGSTTPALAVTAFDEEAERVAAARRLRLLSVRTDPY